MSESTQWPIDPDSEPLLTEGWTYATPVPDSAPPCVVDMPHGTIPRIGPPAMPERLSPDEQAYNARIAAEYKRAQGAAVAAVAAVDSFWRFLREKYGLSEQDDIDEHGVIVRKGAPPSAESLCMDCGQPYEGAGHLAVGGFGQGGRICQSCADVRRAAYRARREMSQNAPQATETGEAQESE